MWWRHDKWHTSCTLSFGKSPGAWSPLLTLPVWNVQEDLPLLASGSSGDVELEFPWQQQQQQQQTSFQASLATVTAAGPCFQVRTYAGTWLCTLLYCAEREEKALLLVLIASSCLQA